MGVYSREDILNIVNEEDIRLLKLQFTDMYGMQKSVSLPASRLEKALSGRCVFDGSSIEGFIRRDEEDMFLHPDLDTFQIFPLSGRDGVSARLICDIYREEGRPFMGDPRYILRRVLAAASEKGYSFGIKPELEFFLFNCDELGNPTTFSGETASYFDTTPLDLSENLRNEMVNYLEDMGYPVASSHHETSAGQHEIDLEEKQGIACADAIVTAKVLIKLLAKRTPGFTGADLQNLLNEAALLAARHDQKTITMGNLEEAIDKVMAGPEKKSRIISDEEKENTAYHEVGHALLAKLLKNTDPLHKVSIIPRGMALGITMTLPEKDHLTMKKSQLLDMITMTLGGRVAEEIVYGKDSITTGASNDLEKVTSLARNMVTKYGMSEKMGNMAYGKDEQHIFMGRDFGVRRDFSEEIAAEIDKEVKKIVDERYEMAKELLIKNRDMLEYISKELLDKETLDEKEFVELMEKVKSDRQNA